MRVSLEASPLWTTLLATALVGMSSGLLAGRFWSMRQEAASESPAKKTAAAVRLPSLPEDLDPAYRETLKKTGDAVARSVRAYPENIHARSALGLLHYLAHDREGEIRCWTRCLELDPEWELAYSRLVALAEQNGEYARIIQLMEKALAHAPGHSWYASQLGEALLYEKQVETARQFLEQQVHRGQASGEVYMALGQVYERLGQPGRAARNFEAAVVLMPDWPDPCYRLASIYSKLGVKEKAAKYQKQFEKLQDSELKQKRSGMNMRVGMQDYLFLPIRVAEIMKYVGQAYLDNDATETGLQWLRRAAETDPKNIDARVLLAEYYNKKKRWAESLKWVESLQKIDPNSLQHLRNAGLLCIHLGQLDKAEQAFKEYCRRAPGDVFGYAALAQLYLQQNHNLQEATQRMRKAIAIAPLAENFWIMANLEHQLNHMESSRHFMRYAIELDPKNPLYRKTYASLSNKAK